MPIPGAGKFTKHLLDLVKPEEIGRLEKIELWHGSPHEFEKFQMSQIGTGEGAQAYGHGLYLAESRGVGEDYQRALGRFGTLDDKRLSEFGVEDAAERAAYDIYKKSKAENISMEEARKLALSDAKEELEGFLELLSMPDKYKLPKKF